MLDLRDSQIHTDSLEPYWIDIDRYAVFETEIHMAESFQDYSAIQDCEVDFP